MAEHQIHIELSPWQARFWATMLLYLTAILWFQANTAVDHSYALSSLLDGQRQIFEELSDLRVDVFYFLEGINNNTLLTAENTDYDWTLRFRENLEDVSAIDGEKIRSDAYRGDDCAYDPLGAGPIVCGLTVDTAPTFHLPRFTYFHN